MARTSGRQLKNLSRDIFCLHTRRFYWILLCISFSMRVFSLLYGNGSKHLSYTAECGEISPFGFWFTLALCQVIVSLLSKISRGAITISILLLAAIDVLPLPEIGWWGTATLFALPFFALGYLASSTDAFNSIKNFKKWQNACMLVAFLVGSLWNGYTNMYTLTTGKSYLLFVFTGLIGTVLLLRLADYIVTYHARVKGFLSFLGRNTILILITHLYAALRFLRSYLFLACHLLPIIWLSKL